MSKMSTQTQARPLFSARLTPRRSLGGRDYRVLAASALIAASVPGMVFFAMGAWPTVGFVGLDLALIWWAFAASARDGKRYEQITLWPDQLEFKQVDGAGKETLRRFNPNGVKLVVDRDFNERTTGIHLRNADHDLVLGAFLNPDEKSSFAKAFGTALRQARR